MRLEVSRRTDLALRVVRAVADAALAERGPISGRRLAEDLATSPPYLAGVVAPLLARGWISSRSGPGGGYSAGPGLAEVTVLDVVEAVEGPLDESSCVLQGGRCGATPCAFHTAWLEARAALRGALAARPVA